MDATEPAGRLGARFPTVLSRAVGGDGEAFGVLWRSAHPGLLRYLYVIGDGQDAEDVASETWLKVIRSLDSFAGDEQAFRGWLATVARNALRDKVRQRSRRPERLDGLLPRDLAGDGAAQTEELALQSISTRSALDLVVRTLTPSVAEMVVLRVVVGLDVTQVAALVGRSPGAVRVAVHRGLKSLAEAVGSAPQPIDPRPTTTRPVTVLALETFSIQ
jgi:RNA polymerase sigma-70 factor, ECF subfamily